MDYRNTYRSFRPEIIRARFISTQIKLHASTNLVLINTVSDTGSQIVQSTAGLLTTVGYQFGEGGPVTYALEGSVAIGGGVGVVRVLSV